MHVIDLPAGTGVADLLADPARHARRRRPGPRRPRPTRATPTTPPSGRCRTSAGTRSSAPPRPSGTAVVALLDTGVDASHPDLAGQLVAGTSILDGSDGTSDPNGHGTWMAGIIAAATDNGTGIAGIGYAGV